MPDAHSVGEALAVEDCDRDADPVAHTLALKVAVLQSEADTETETEPVPEAEPSEEKEEDTDALLEWEALTVPVRDVDCVPVAQLEGLCVEQLDDDGEVLRLGLGVALSEATPDPEMETVAEVENVAHALGLGVNELDTLRVTEPEADEESVAAPERVAEVHALNDGETLGVPDSEERKEAVPQAVTEEEAVGVELPQEEAEALTVLDALPSAVRVAHTVGEYEGKDEEEGVLEGCGVKEGEGDAESQSVGLEETVPQAVTEEETVRVELPQEEAEALPVLDALPSAVRVAHTVGEVEVEEEEEVVLEGCGVQEGEGDAESLELSVALAELQAVAEMVADALPQEEALAVA